MQRRGLFHFAGTMALLIAAGAVAQDGARDAGGEEARPTKLEDLPPAVRLGVRVELLRRSLPVSSTVVIVDRAGAYVEAISRWSVEARFPVLVDDGSDAARENIARFVRAFEPARVVRWSAGGTGGGGRFGRATMEQIATAIGAAWGAAPGQSPAERWVELGFFPPGIVATSTADPAWTAALALGAGRGQPVIDLQIDGAVGRNVGAPMQQEHFDAIDAQISGALDASGLPWRALGDAVDAVTLCLNTPSKLAADERPLAVTDRFGRHAGGERYAWAGQVHGSEAGAAYRAMCALFLQPERAWLFDGYKEEAPFTQYDVAPAAAALAEAGIASTIDDQPGAELSDWRLRAAGAIDAGLVLVNTSGTRWWFELGIMRQRANTSDVPMLAAPAIVHFIHSFSAQNIGDRSSIAARWLEQGAYAYVGAVDEPYLSAFQTQESFAKRLLAPAPLGAAARLDGGPVWKVNVLGDPLITLSSPGLRTTRERPTDDDGAPRRIEEAPRLDGALPLDEILTAALKEKRFDEALAALVMLGRDADAVRLVEAIRRDQPEALTGSVAGVALPAAFRGGRANLVVALYGALDERAAGDMLTVDLLWLAAGSLIDTSDDASLADTLRARVRASSLGEDGAALARLVSRTRGVDAARVLLNDLMKTTEDQRHLRELQRELTRLGR